MRYKAEKRSRKKIVIISVCSLLAVMLAAAALYAVNRPEYTLLKLRNEYRENGMEVTQKYLTGSALDTYRKTWDFINRPIISLLPGAALPIYRGVEKTVNDPSADRIAGDSIGDYRMIVDVISHKTLLDILNDPELLGRVRECAARTVLPLISGLLDRDTQKLAYALCRGEGKLTCKREDADIRGDLADVTLRVSYGSASGRVILHMSRESGEWLIFDVEVPFGDITFSGKEARICTVSNMPA